MHAVLARFVGLFTIRLANEEVLPFTFKPYVEALEKGAPRRQARRTMRADPSPSQSASSIGPGGVPHRNRDRVASTARRSRKPSPPRAQAPRSARWQATSWWPR
jgi:hypothetical protein